MTVTSYLFWRAAQAILSNEEQESISRSLASLRTRLNLHFTPAAIPRQIPFGSFRRGTILPRRMDPGSDVDFMVVFAEPGYQPQTYLDRLRRFVERRYRTSEIYQSSPTIVLELNHIRFELVPALASSGPNTFLIPLGPDNWQPTSPLTFQTELEAKNRECGSMLKPAIRLLKYWNVKNGYVLPPFLLEQWVVNQRYYGCQNVRDYLFEMLLSLPGSYDTQWRQERVQRARDLVATIRSYDGSTFYGLTAEQETKKLIPPS